MTPWYDRDGVTIYHGDCLEVMAGLEPGFDLVFTSPPYNLGGAGNHDLRGSRPRRSKRWGSYARAPLANGYGVHGDDMPWSAYVAWQRRVLSACWGLLADDGAIFYNHKPVIRRKTLRLPLECNPDLPLRQIVTWDRGGGFNFTATHYGPVTEWLLVFAKPGWRLRNQSASTVTDLWRASPDQSTPHPAPFPLALPARAIETTGARRVLDPFAGWGTTLLAAKAAGAAAVGVEIEERYCEMAARRLGQGVLPFGEAAG